MLRTANVLDCGRSKQPTIARQPKIRKYVAPKEAVCKKVYNQSAQIALKIGTSICYALVLLGTDFEP